MRYGFLIVLYLGNVFLSKASDLLEVLPLTEKIIMLHFDDGYVDHYGYHEEGNNDRIFNYPLNIARSVHVYSYLLSSTNDPAYADPVNPVKTGRKSKPMDISDSCKWTGTICDNDFVYEHWIYLDLPQALTNGSEYTLWLGDLAENMDAFTFVFDEFNLRSDLIHVNQLGYRPTAGMKYAYLAHWAGDFGDINLEFLNGRKFYLVNYSDRSIAYQGNITTKRRDLADTDKDFNNQDTWGTTNNFYGSDVWEIDFSTFTTPGEYILVVEGVGHSFPFRLDENVYREAYYYTVRGLYYQRAGIAKEAAFAGKWAQPRDHHPDDGVELYYTKWPSVKSLEGNTSKDSLLANVVGPITDWGWGWYHDAGDWDGYVHHTEVPYQLMVSYEMAAQNYRDNELNIPESGNGIPDILDEAGWLIQYFRRNQQPSGGVAGGRVNSDFNSKGDGIPSYEDPRPWYVCGEDPQTSYLFAGLAAQYAYCLELAGITDSTDALVTAAGAAYTWAGNNHAMAPDEKVKGATLTDLRMYAAASLFKITGDTNYQSTFASLNKVTAAATSLSGGGYDQTKAVWSYVTSPDHPGINSTLKSTLSEAAINYAEADFLLPARQRSARTGYSLNLPPIVGSTTTPILLAPMVAHYLAEGQQKKDFLDYMQTTADYYLGNNPLNMSWIVGLGDRAPRRMLHLDSRYDQVEEYVPGLVPYGPTRHGDHFMGEDAQGPWDADFAKIHSYPERYSWPISEAWFDSPYSVMDGEFTVHQNSAQSAASYGFLSADTNQEFTPNALPEISILSPASDLTLDEQDSLNITLTVTDDDRVSFVEYYLGHHMAGRVNTPPYAFAVPVMDILAGSFRLAAVAYDNQGGCTRVESRMISISHNYQPAILISPQSDSLAQGQSLEVIVDASAISGATPGEVRLFLNGISMGQDDIPPFDFHIDSILPLYNEIKAVVKFNEGFSSSVKLAKYAVPEVAAVSFKKKEINIRAKEYYSLEYEIFPEEAGIKNVVFETTADSIATVNDRGRVSALSEGSAEIIITTIQGGFSDTARLTVLPKRPEGPYHGDPVVLPAMLEAEDYDFGGEGFAYHDLSPGNSEEGFRNEDVDIQQTYDDGTAFHITNIQAGEWTNYTIYAPESNNYSVRFRYTAGSGDATVTLKVNGQEIKRVILPGVSWYPFADFMVDNVFIPEGEQTLSIYFNTGKLTLNYIDITCLHCSTILPREIHLNYHDVDVAIGGKLQLAAQIIPFNASNHKVFWKSLYDSIVYVDTAGQLTALRKGSTNVVVQSESMELTDTCLVNVVAGSAFTPGIAYEYFEGDWDKVPDFAGMTPVSRGNISNFNLSPATAEDYFGFRYYGDIRIDTSGNWSFFINSDDGSLLFIDGVKVVDNDGLHAAMEQGGSLQLDTGRHQIEVMFFEKGGGAALDVSYQGPGISKAAIPDSILGTWVVGGEIIFLDGMTFQDTILAPLKTNIYPAVQFTPTGASDKKVNMIPADTGILSISGFGYITGLVTGTTNLYGTSRDGNYADSSVVIVINDIPEVSLLSPSEGSVFQDSTEIMVRFTAADSIGGIRESSIIIDDQTRIILGKTQSLYLFDSLPAGEHSIYILAMDIHGEKGYSDTIQFKVELTTTVRDLTTVQTFTASASPNPFNGSVLFNIDSRRAGKVEIRIYNLAGSLVKMIGPTKIPAGRSTLDWTGRGQGNADLPPGLYSCLVSTENHRNIVLLKLLKQ